MHECVPLPDLEAILAHLTRELGVERERVNALVDVFPQVWGSTCGGIDVTDDDGVVSAVFSGDAITTEYTVVVNFGAQGQFYAVYFGGEFAYVVQDPTDRFFEDLKNHQLRSKGDVLKLHMY